VARRKERRAAARLAAAEAAGEVAPGEAADAAAPGDAAGTDGSADSEEGESSGREEKAEADGNTKDATPELRSASEPSNAGTTTLQQPAIQQPLTSPIPGSTGRVSLDWRRIGTPAAGLGAGTALEGAASPPRQAGRGGAARVFGQAVKNLG